MSKAPSPAEFDTIATTLRKLSGIVIGFDKLYLVETRLGSILREHGLRDLSELAARLRAPFTNALAEAVVEAMTTNETLFFRDGKPFTHVQGQALPRLHAARPPAARLRIWSAAASAGQEAYSLAMVVAEQKATLGGRKVEIVGTDLARAQLARAREGLYTQLEIQRGLPMQMLVRYFRTEDTSWRVAQALRDMVQFREWNLLADLRPLGLFDIVFCRNVLIYFDRATKTQVLEAIAGQLQPDGLLYLGGAETVLGLTDRFTPLPDARGVYALASPVTDKRPIARAPLALAGA